MKRDNKNDSGKPDTRRAERLAQARRFLEAGRTGIDPPPSLSAAKDDETRSDTAKEKTGKTAGNPGDNDPTRFGDWEKNGRCIDF